MYAKSFPYYDRQYILATYETKRLDENIQKLNELKQLNEEENYKKWLQTTLHPQQQLRECPNDDLDLSNNDFKNGFYFIKLIETLDQATFGLQDVGLLRLINRLQAADAALKGALRSNKFFILKKNIDNLNLILDYLINVKKMEQLKQLATFVNVYEMANGNKKVILNFIFLIKLFYEKLNQNAGNNVATIEKESEKVVIDNAESQIERVTVQETKCSELGAGDHSRYAGSIEVKDNRSSSQLESVVNEANILELDDDNGERESECVCEEIDHKDELQVSCVLDSKSVEFEPSEQMGLSSESVILNAHSQQFKFEWLEISDDTVEATKATIEPIMSQNVENNEATKEITEPSEFNDNDEITVESVIEMADNIEVPIYDEAIEVVEGNHEVSHVDKCELSDETSSIVVQDSISNELTNAGDTCIVVRHSHDELEVLEQEPIVDMVAVESDEQNTFVCEIVLENEESIVMEQADDDRLKEITVEEAIYLNNEIKETIRDDVVVVLDDKNEVEDILKDKLTDKTEDYKKVEDIQVPVEEKIVDVQIEINDKHVISHDSVNNEEESDKEINTTLDFNQNSFDESKSPSPVLDVQQEETHNEDHLEEALVEIEELLSIVECVNTNDEQIEEINEQNNKGSTDMSTATFDDDEGVAQVMVEEIKNKFLNTSLEDSCHQDSHKDNYDEDNAQEIDTQNTNSMIDSGFCQNDSIIGIESLDEMDLNSSFDCKRIKGDELRQTVILNDEIKEEEQTKESSQDEIFTVDHSIDFVNEEQTEAPISAEDTKDHSVDVLKPQEPSERLSLDLKCQEVKQVASITINKLKNENDDSQDCETDGADTGYCQTHSSNSSCESNSIDKCPDESDESSSKTLLQNDKIEEETPIVTPKTTIASKQRQQKPRKAKKIQTQVQVTKPSEPVVVQKQEKANHVEEPVHVEAKVQPSIIETPKRQIQQNLNSNNNNSKSSKNRSKTTDKLVKIANDKNNTNETKPNGHEAKQTTQKPTATPKPTTPTIATTATKLSRKKQPKAEISSKSSTTAITTPASTTPTLSSNKDNTWFNIIKYLILILILFLFVSSLFVNYYIDDHDGDSYFNCYKNILNNFKNILQN